MTSRTTKTPVNRTTKSNAAKRMAKAKANKNN